MGLKNNTANIKYLRVREGKFYVGKDTETPYGELEGTITGLRYKDEEYEGAPIRKLIINLNDGEDNYQLGLNVESQNYATLVSFLRNADLTKPLTLHPKLEAGNKDGKDFKRYSILISQNGKFVKGYFTKDNPNGLPAWKTVKVGNKKVTDKSDYLDFMEQFVTRNYITVVEKQAQEQPVAKATKPEGVLVTGADGPDDDTEVEGKEKLPWDD